MRTCARIHAHLTLLADAATELQQTHGQPLPNAMWLIIGGTPAAVYCRARALGRHAARGGLCTAALLELLKLLASADGGCTASPMGTRGSTLAAARRQSLLLSRARRAHVTLMSARVRGETGLRAGRRAHLHKVQRCQSRRRRSSLRVAQPQAATPPS